MNSDRSLFTTPPRPEPAQEADTIKGGPWDGFALVGSYSRAQAIEDGVLVDVTKHAAEVGFLVSVCLTVAVWGMIERIPTSGFGREGDVQGRLHDVLWLAFIQARRHNRLQSLVYQVILPTAGTRRRYVTLVLHSGPGDQGEPVLTIMLPGED